MRHEELVDRVAPCGLDCGKCLNNPKSPISLLSAELRRELGGFAARAPFFAGMDPVFGDYPAFERVLGRFMAASCQGCRTGTCLFEGCRVQTCVRERGVDYCFQCPDYPCQATGFTGALLERWKVNNDRLAEMGLEAYFAWIKDKPRY